MQNTACLSTGNSASDCEFHINQPNQKEILHLAISAVICISVQKANPSWTFCSLAGFSLNQEGGQIISHHI